MEATKNQVLSAKTMEEARLAIKGSQLAQDQKEVMFYAVAVAFNRRNWQKTFVTVLDALTK